MSKTALEELKKVIQVNPYLTLESIRSESFIFEKRVRLNCFYCTKYNTKWTCPPRIPEFDYKAIIEEYQNEATGVNVIKSLDNIGIKIEFPLINKFYRFGLIAW